VGRVFILGGYDMEIFFRPCEYGISFGGGLEEPFTYLNRAVSDRFKAEEIMFPYGEIEIQLTYLPLKADDKALEWYSKLPRYYRGKNMVNVYLPVNAQESKGGSIETVFGLLHKAFDLIISKKKKDDKYDATKIKMSLHQLEEELKTCDIWEIHEQYKSLLRQEHIQRNKEERITREQSHAEKKRLIQAIRLYYYFENIGLKYFAPYDHRLCDKILEKLRERKFRLPDYTHLYIVVSDTFENALYHTTRMEKWYVCGIAVLEDYVAYADKKDPTKKQIVFDLIKQGLYDISKIDKLDTEVLNEVLYDVAQNYRRI
jgi:hypothetical protein